MLPEQSQAKAWKVSPRPGALAGAELLDAPAHLGGGLVGEVTARIRSAGTPAWMSRAMR